MQRFRIDPREHPKRPEESWWIVHPNAGGVEFRLPNGAVTVCTEDLAPVFKAATAYNVIGADNHNGWVTVEGGGDLYDMPQYLFARHFDAEAFVVGTANPADLEQARPFDYRPTVPRRPSAEQLELFKG